MTDMTAYEVTAGNSYFYQRLVVLAADEEKACRLFSEYLLSAEVISEEVEEYTMALHAWKDADIDDDEDETNNKAPQRHEYHYVFDDADVKEFDGNRRWHGTPTSEVQMMSSGGNG